MEKEIVALHNGRIVIPVEVDRDAVSRGQHRPNLRH